MLPFERGFFVLNFEFVRENNLWTSNIAKCIQNLCFSYLKSFNVPITSMLALFLLVYF